MACNDTIVIMKWTISTIAPALFVILYSSAPLYAAMAKVREPINYFTKTIEKEQLCNSE